MVYYHVWDNRPYPFYNRYYYLSNDHVVTISKVTDDVVKTVAPEVPSTYIPHAVHPDFFKPATDEQVKEAKLLSLEPRDRDKFIFFWNNRNARRKQSGTLVWWFKEWLDKKNLHDKAMLIMHTEPKDPHGQDLEHIIHHLGLNDGQVLLSVNKVPPDQLGFMYNMVDCTINISDAEGFGLGTLESLSCGTPIIVNMTGGLQEQVTDGEHWFGMGINPTSKAIIGSQDVPYIYEDRICGKQFVEKLVEFYNLSDEKRKEMGTLGRKHVMDNYGFSQYAGQWFQAFNKLFETCGSWETRKNHKSWSLIEI
jgi:glycosyltransferase involved in cell wall biosynthesis